MKIEDLFGGMEAIRTMYDNEEFMDKVIYKMIDLRDLYEDDALFERDYARLCFIRFDALTNPSRFKLFQIALWVADDGVDDMYNHVCWKFQDLIEICGSTEDDPEEDVCGLNMTDSAKEILSIKTEKPDIESPKSNKADYTYPDTDIFI